MSQFHWADAEDRVRRARRLIAEKRWAEAAVELRAALSISPYQIDWHIQLGRALDEMGQFEQAIDAYRDALEIDADHVHALNHLGVSLHRLGRNPAAIEIFDRLEAIDPAFEPAYCNRILCYTELGDHQRAEEMFYTARLYRDQCPTCYFNIGQSLAARGQLDRAIFCWQKTIDLSGDHVRVRARIAETLRHRGFQELARRHYIEGLRLEPNDAPVLLDYVSLLIDMRRFDEAEAKLEQAVRVGPTSARIPYTRAALLLARGRLDASADALRSVLQLDPTFAGANLMLAQIAVRRGDTIRAKSHLRAELLLRPDSGRILLDLGNMLIDVGELRLAVACLRRLAQAEPDNVRAWQNLAVAECLRGRHNRGVEACLHALDIDAGNVAVRHNLALAYIELGQFDYAAEEIAFGLRLNAADRALKKLRIRLFVLTQWQRMRKLLFVER